ncbi:MAG: RHS repeat-associated core domain-containing protein, partial [Chlamydiae bacterium]|nr:RHS repeat-associated core domain-containing protein [Chlamydiota bacterium]
TIFDKDGLQIDKSSIGNFYQYTGREYDVETGLQNSRARYYDPALARFISKDPIGFAGGVNVYQYTGSNPINWIDPWGLKTYVKSRDVKGLGGAAAHTWVEVHDCEGRSTYSGTDDNGKLGVQKNYPPDYSPTKSNPPTSSREVRPPPGMSQEDWDRAVRESGERERKKCDLRDYKRMGGDRGTKSGNCHVVTTQTITGAGGTIPSDYDPPGLNPGLGDKK